MGRAFEMLLLAEVIGLPEDEVEAVLGRLQAMKLVRPMREGEVVGELAKDQRARTIRVGFERMDLRQLQDIRIDGADGAILTLGDVAEPRIVEGPREILRQDQRRVGRVSGYLAEGAVLSAAIARVKERIAALPLPPGYRVRIGGEEREREEEERYRAEEREYEQAELEDSEG